MPAVSRQQQKWAFAVKGAKWARAHHFDTKGPLPKRVPATAKQKGAIARLTGSRSTR